MKHRITLFATLIFCLSSSHQWLEPVEYDINVSYVNIWVKATDGKGKAVTDLSVADLQVLEDGKPVQPECFEQVKYDISEMDPLAEFNEESLQPEDSNAAKKFVVFLDLFNSTMGEMHFIQPRIQDFLLHEIDDRSDVMLAALLPNRKMGVLVPFTENHESVVDVIRRAPANQTRDTKINRNKSQLLDMIRDWEQTGRDVDSPADFYRRAVGMIRVLSQEEKEQGRFTLRALRTFSDYLATSDLGDHTVIVYVSGGFTTEPGRHYYTLLESAMQRYLADPKVSEPDVVVGTPEQDFDVVNDIRDTAWYMNRLNVTLYSVDARGLIANGQDATSENLLNLSAGGEDYFASHSHQEALMSLAKETGGLAFIGTQNFSNSFSSMVRDLNHQYLVCYRAPEHKKRGQYHKIRVISKRPGVELRYRQGYMG